MAGTRKRKPSGTPPERGYASPACSAHEVDPDYMMAPARPAAPAGRSKLAPGVRPGDRAEVGDGKREER